LRTILKINLAMNFLPPDAPNEPLTSTCAASPQAVGDRALADLPKRARGIVVGHGTDAALAERLSAVGLGLGVSFTVVQAGRRALLQVGEARLALGPELTGAVRALPR
jgi:Fe2+ transport system protein FeoA